MFYQDTKHLPGRMGPRDKLMPAKSNPKITLRVNQDNAGNSEVRRKNSVTDPESVTAVHVNDKMKTLAQDFFKKPNSKQQSLPGRKMSEPDLKVTKPSTRNLSDSQNL